MPSRDLSYFALYGRGVFTTAAIRDGRPVFWYKHWRRLVRNADALGIDLTEHTEGSTLKDLESEIDACKIVDGRARIAFSDESPSRIWSTNATEKKTSLSIIVGELRPIPKEFKLTVSPHRTNTTSPLVGIKSCNYLDHLLAYEDARKQGFHEAIRINERSEVTCACMANVFWEKDGKLCTPSLKTGCLPGTTREYLLENIECDEVEASIGELEEADRIFVTSAGIGVVKVSELDGRPLETLAHPLTHLLPF